MPGESISRGSGAFRRFARPRWWNTLAFRLGAAINLTVIAVLAVSAWVDHRRDADAQIQHALRRLQEEAHVLRAAWTQFGEPVSFQRFVDEFCMQMTATASPGHHIALFDPTGRVVVRAHERADPELESLMGQNSMNNAETFEFHGERFGSVSLQIGNRTRLAVAVSLQPVEEMLREQGISRAAATGVLVVVIFGVTAICLIVWVRDPLRGFVQVVSAVSERRFDQRVEPRGADELRFLADGMNGMVKALGRTERERAFEMQRAQQIQRALVGNRDLAVNGYRIRSIFLPTESVGGDFFDIVPLRDGSTLVAVVDVTGHGIPGALCTALLRSSLRHLTRVTNDVAEIARGLNRDLCDIAAAGVYATAVLVRLGPDSRGLEYANAGHDAPLLTTPDGGVTALNHAGLLLGVGADAGYEATRVEVAPPSRLFLFTDGLHEAMSPQGELFGRERMSELFAETSHLPLEKQLSAVLSAVRAFCGREDFDDDVTVLAVCWSDAHPRA